LDLLHGPHVSTKYRQEGGDQIDLSQAESDHDVLKKKMGTRKGRSFFVPSSDYSFIYCGSICNFSVQRISWTECQLYDILCIYVLYIYICVYRVLKVMFFTNPPATFFPPFIFWEMFWEMTIRFFRPKRGFSPGRFLKSPRSKMARPIGRFEFFPSRYGWLLRYAEKHANLEYPAAGCRFVTPKCGVTRRRCIHYYITHDCLVGILIQRSQPGNSWLKLLISTAWLLIVTKLLRQKLVKSW